MTQLVQLSRFVESQVSTWRTGRHDPGFTAAANVNGIQPRRLANYRISLRSIRGRPFKAGNAARPTLTPIVPQLELEKRSRIRDPTRSKGEYLT